MKNKVFYITLLLLTACDAKKETHSFYDYYMLAHDVWRLPVIEPYQLNTADCCNYWIIDASSKFGIDFEISATVDSINVDNGFILIDNSEMGEDYYALNIKEKSYEAFSNRTEFDSFREKNNLSKQLYLTETVYYGWKKTGQLPWAKEVLKVSQ